MLKKNKKVSRRQIGGNICLADGVSRSPFAIRLLQFQGMNIDRVLEPVNMETFDDDYLTANEKAEIVTNPLPAEGATLSNNPFSLKGLFKWMGFK